jgi:hydroxymethylpyrimidine pyrophosphatase-like HAD family hydrolase
LNPKGEIEYDLHLVNDEVQRILDVTSPYFDEVGFCVDSEWHLDEEGCSHEHVNGISFTCYDQEKSHLLISALATLPLSYTTSVGKHWQETEWIGILLSHPDASKGKGIKAIQEKLHILPSETIAIGDSAHDLTMFDSAGLKVAVRNAEEVLKEKADIIAPSMQKDGVVEIIEKYILQDLQ